MRVCLSEYFNKNDTVVVGLSGGADSVTLTHLMKFNNDLELKVIACHINHNLRGEESLRDMEFVKSLCKEWDIPLFIKDVDIKALCKKDNLSEEECGRKVRYDFFNKTADKFCAKIATAHTLSDNAETVLFNLARGSALKGLCGIPKQRENIVRPLLSLTRSDIEAYCKKHNLSYVTDSTNEKTDYTRNYIRHNIIPELKRINPAFETAVLRTTQSISSDDEYLSYLAGECYKKIKSKNTFDCNTLKNEHKSVRNRVIRLILSEFGFELSHKNIESVDKIIIDGVGKINIKDNMFIEIKDNILAVSDGKIKEEYFEFPLKDGRFLSKTGKTYNVQTLDTNQIKTVHKVYKKLFDISLDCGKICGSIVVRQRKSGDKIKLKDNMYTKKVKKLLCENEIPLQERQKLFVIADDAGVIALEGFGIDVRVKCDENTTCFIRVSEICED